MFWYLDKQTDRPLIFGSIAAISKHSGIKADKLYHHFSRMKRVEFENEVARIAKCEVNRISKVDNKT